MIGRAFRRGMVVRVPPHGPLGIGDIRIVTRQSVPASLREHPTVASYTYIPIGRATFSRETLALIGCPLISGVSWSSVSDDASFRQPISLNSSVQKRKDVLNIGYDEARRHIISGSTLRWTCVVHDNAWQAKQRKDRRLAWTS